MTDHESDDKAFAAMSLAMPNLPPTFCSVYVRSLAALGPPSDPDRMGDRQGSCEPRTIGKAKEMIVRFRTEHDLAFLSTAHKFIAGLAFCVPLVGGGP